LPENGNGATDARHAVCLLPSWDGLYERGKPLSDYFARLPRHVAWTCDPSGKNERLELKKAGFNIREGINAKAFGINLVTRWPRSGRLKIVRSLCPNLTSEAPRYHYAGARDGLPRIGGTRERTQPRPRCSALSLLPPAPAAARASAAAASPTGPGEAPAVPPVAPAPPPARKPRPGAGSIARRCGRGYAERCASAPHHP
jgi:hypothetical protein